jgi:hypothetical protein
MANRYTCYIRIKMFKIVPLTLEDESVIFLVINKITNVEVARYDNYKDAWADVTAR